MNEKTMYGYCRVSTVKQGEGTSLAEQKSSIERYAAEHGLTIKAWFEELETAAKQGRPKFSKMLALLNDKQADGVIIHKIDRSARNLRDWATLGDLIDLGIEVHFSHEAVDFNTRGGRLAADITAVFSADYIRNLREETKKGQRGRLKQGLYPWGAPLGYLDTGRGNIKEVDPERGSLINSLFETYASGLYSYEQMSQLMYGRGLRNKLGKIVSKKRISEILNNPFYTGIIRIKRTGETYSGVHKPIVEVSTYKRVQQVLSGKRHPSYTKHDYLYRKCIKCDQCNLALIAETQKGHVYYRCQRPNCPTKTVREEHIDLCVKDFLRSITLKKNEIEEIRQFFEQRTKKASKNTHAKIRAASLEKKVISQKLDRLAEKFAEDLIEQSTYENVRTKFLLQSKKCEEKQTALERANPLSGKQVEELLKSLALPDSWQQCQDNQEKRHLIKILTLNLSYTNGQLNIVPNTPFDAFLQFEVVSSCCHVRHSVRTKKTVTYTVTKTKTGDSEIIPLNERKKFSHAQLLRAFQRHDVMQSLKTLCVPIY